MDTRRIWRDISCSIWTRAGYGAIFRAQIVSGNIARYRNASHLALHTQHTPLMLIVTKKTNTEKELKYVVMNQLHRPPKKKNITYEKLSSSNKDALQHPNELRVIANHGHTRILHHICSHMPAKWHCARICCGRSRYIWLYTMSSAGSPSTSTLTGTPTPCCPCIRS